MPTLVTRLAGRRVALSRINTGFGPVLWGGEFTDNQGRPIGLHQGRGERFQKLVVSSPDIAGTLDGLQRLGETWTTR